MMMMFGYKLSSKSEKAMRLLKYMWAIFTPIFSMGIFIIGAISYSELDYKRKTFTYQYPKWAIGVGWVLALISVIWIPIIFVTRLLQTPGTLRERLAINTMPRLQRHQIRNGEDMSKIILIDDDGTHLEDFATGTNTEPLPSFKSHAFWKNLTALKSSCLTSLPVIYLNPRSTQSNTKLPKL